MNYGSVCSGIEAATVAWHPLGWKAQWFSEIEPFPSKLLNHYYPHVPNLGDMTKLNEKEEYNESIIDVLVGGTPCQSFSIAGLRNGMADERGNLSLEYCKILLRKQPKWFVWENVPGVFSSFSNDTKGTVEFKGKRWSISSGETDITNTSDFATLLAAFQQCGYSFSYRVFDSKHFGVPQRRRRVFVVGHLGNDWRPSAAVLFERDSLRRDFTPGKEKRKGTSGTTEEGVRSYGIQGNIIGRQPGNGGNGLGFHGEESPTLTKADKHGVASFGTDLSQRPDKIQIYENESTTLTKGGTAPGFKAHVITKWPADLAPTLNTYYGTKQGLENQHIDSGAPLFVPYIMPTTQGDGAGKILENQIATLNCMHEQPVLFQPLNIRPPLIFKIRGGKEGGGKGYLGQEEESFTITKGGDQYLFQTKQPIILEDQGGSVMNVNETGIVGTLRSQSHGHEPILLQPIVYAFDSLSSNSMKSANPHSGVHIEDVAKTLDKSRPDPSKNQRGNAIVYSPENSRYFQLWDFAKAPLLKPTTGKFWQIREQQYQPFQVRRLTPLECGRLQGFPDGYGNIPGASDTALYAAFGNSMTVQVMRWIGERITLVHGIIEKLKGEQKI